MENTSSMGGGGGQGGGEGRKDGGGEEDGEQGGEGDGRGKNIRDFYYFVFVCVNELRECVFWFRV